jgi:hypothetical protein
MNRQNSIDVLRRPRSQSARAFLEILLAVLLVGQPWIAGCSCRPSANKSASKQTQRDPLRKQDKQKPDFEVKDLRVMPNDESFVSRAIKPGHWSSAILQMKANNADFLGGELDCFAGSTNGTIFDIKDTSFGLHIVRPVALPKGQAKSFELLYFAPTAHGELRNINFFSNLNFASSAARRWDVLPQPTTRLKPHQNYMVVLSRRPDSYAFLKLIPTVKPPTSSFVNSDGLISDYVVVMPKTQRKIDLPSNPFAWTSIAYIICDDIDPGILSADQQQAFLDWIHWGGQLIISGPESMDELQGSFLAKYLPAKAGEVFRLSEPSLAELNESWSIPRSQPRNRIQLAGAPHEAIRLLLNAEGSFVPGTGELVAERRVGRGRLVVTAFRLNDREFVNWPCFDNLMNGCLLRRPPRVFVQSPLPFETDVRWAKGLSPVRHDSYDDDVSSIDSESNPRLQRSLFDSLLTSKLRYFSRDASRVSPEGAEASHSLHLDIDGYAYERQAGVAGWNDASEASSIVRNVLKKLGGVEVPDASFVLGALGIYLLILVPANWAIFRILGRLELAWAAVPVIAVAGTFLVAWLAQLDIGFVRGRTEICILETQPDYPHGHLTRYTALYSSLSTTYSFGFADATAVAQPFPIQLNAPAPSFRDRDVVTLRQGGQRDFKTVLSRFPVSSTNTGMVHSEQMIDLDGPLSVVDVQPGRYELANQLQFPLKDTGIVTMMDGKTYTAWIGELDPKQKRVFEFTGRMGEDIGFEQWESSRITQANVTPGELNLRDLFTLAIDPKRLNEGDMRMVAWIDVDMPGLVITPSASQSTVRTVVVANLRYGPLPKPASDENTYLGVAAENAADSDADDSSAHDDK